VTQPGNTRPRDRRNEPSEQQRTERQRNERCIDCNRPSSTQRCPDCRKRVESETERYHGQSKPGRMPRSREDLEHLACAIEAVTAAHRAIAQLAFRTELLPRERKQALAEPLAQVDLGRRFLVEVLAKNGAAPSETSDGDPDDADVASRARFRPRDPNYATRYEARVEAKECTRCGDPAVPGRKTCRRCSRRLRRQWRRYAARGREEERKVRQGVRQGPTTTKFQDRSRKRAS
jgi:predicted amidophosphoribosyltransferase